LLKRLENTGDKILVYLVDLRTKTAKEISFEDFKGEKINYPFTLEIDCDDVSEEYLKRVQRNKGVKAFLKRNIKKVVFYSILLVGSLGFLYKVLTENNAPPPTPKKTIHKIPKVVKKKLQKKEKCLSNLPSFVKNFVLGAKVETDKKGEVYISFQTHNGELIKAKLPLTEWNKPFSPAIDLEPGISVRKSKIGYEFVGNDYDMCLFFISGNTDKPLYIISLDEKGCVIVLPDSCLRVFAKSNSSNFASE